MVSLISFDLICNEYVFPCLIDVIKFSIDTLEPSEAIHRQYMSNDVSVHEVLYRLSAEFKSIEFLLIVRGRIQVNRISFNRSQGNICWQK